MLKGEKVYGVLWIRRISGDNSGRNLREITCVKDTTNIELSNSFGKLGDGTSQDSIQDLTISLEADKENRIFPEVGEIGKYSKDRSVNVRTKVGVKDGAKRKQTGPTSSLGPNGPTHRAK
ncbi:unnamed protein product [Microthlaspi erraticum]|uniref:Uncharacterized protein n=1 Tax=Microthlaspi erraticum TaxID=1685480 RepID=A0A6D2L8J8_9BRAS|nr:unnamed protein product [Microthlaspi erraticum]